MGRRKAREEASGCSMLPSVVAVWIPNMHIMTPTHVSLQLQEICHHPLAFLASGPQCDLQVRSSIRVAGTLNCSVFSPVPERYSFKDIKLHFLFTPFYWVRKVPRKPLAPILILPYYDVIYLPPPPVNENKLSLPSFYCFLSSILPPQQEKQVEKNKK